MKEAASPIVFDAEGQPRSRLYDDVYFSRAGGLAEARQVFLAGCGLPERWAGRRRFVVGELGFGAGLNIAALLALWRERREPDARLCVFSVEAHPIGASDAERALSAWPELEPVARLILERWPGRRPGFHRIDLPELAATLDVAVMPAEAALEAWSGRADAWFLDGFSPAKNPAMWTPRLMRLVAERSNVGAHAATYSVAGDVRRALAVAGFAVKRWPGFGGKRQRLEARLAGSPSDPAEPRVAVVGAGIAGASLARAFKELGAPVRLFDAHGRGAGASGNVAALVTPRLDAGLGAVARLHAQAFGRASKIYAGLDGTVIARGVLQLEASSRDGARFAKIAASDVFEPGALILLGPAETTARLGEPVPAGLCFNDGLVVEPARVLAAFCPDVERGRIGRLEWRGATWRLLGPDAVVLAEADVVCLAAGADLARLWPGAPVRPVRGQISWVGAVAAPAAAAWGAYIAPTRDGFAFGATYDRGETGQDQRAADDARNLAALARRLPALARRLAGAAIEGRAAIRAATPDHLPLAGEASPGLFVLGGLASRGYALAPLLAEHVAAEVLGAPSPLPADLARIVCPGRFVRAERRDGRSGLAVQPEP
jgi:tRNA 5-methylaminomethyl-2-thiouridine biosynthesis bifunctional protein